MDVRREARDGPQPFEDPGGVAGSHLQDRAELFGKQGGQRLRAEPGEIDAKPGPSRERHLAEGGGEPAVGSIVVGEHDPFRD